MSIWLVIVVLKSSLFLTVGAMLIAMVDSKRIARTGLFRGACVFVLLQGWCWFHIPFPQRTVETRSPAIVADIVPQSEWVQTPPTTVVFESSEHSQPLQQLLLPDTNDGPLVDSRLIDIKHLQVAATGLVGIWLLGIGLLLIRSCVRYRRFHRELDLAAAPNSLRSMWAAVCCECSIEVTDIAVSADVGPAIMQRGFRSVLVIPGDLLSQLSETQLRGILIHEAAHIARRDIWKSLGVRLLGGLHWFNPCAWMIVRRFDEAAEWACDAQCKSLLSDDITEFAKAILENVAPEKLPSLSLGVRGHRMADRIRRMLFPEQIKESKMRIGLLCIALMAVAFANAFEPVSKALADDSKQQTQAEADPPVDAAQGSVSAQDGKVKAEQPRKPSPDTDLLASWREQLRELEKLHFEGGSEAISDAIAGLKEEISQNENSSIHWDVEIWECDAWALKFPQPQASHISSVRQVNGDAETMEVESAGKAKPRVLPPSRFRAPGEVFISRSLRTLDDGVQPLLNHSGGTFPAPVLRESLPPMEPRKHWVAVGSLPSKPSSKALPLSIAVLAHESTDPELTGSELRDRLKELKRTGQGKLQSQPRLIAQFGHTSRLCSGGEAPVAVTTEGGTPVIKWEEFGTTLELRAIRLGNNRVRSEFDISFTERDYSQNVIVNDIAIPSFNTRACNIAVEHDFQDTFVFRGILTPPNPLEKETARIILITPRLGPLYRQATPDEIKRITNRLVQP